MSETQANYQTDKPYVILGTQPVVCSPLLEIQLGCHLLIIQPDRSIELLIGQRCDLSGHPIYQGCNLDSDEAYCLLQALQTTFQ
jgi:hypothetical protein